MLMSDGAVRNAYTLKLRNMQNRPRPLTVALQGLPGGTMWSDGIPRAAAARALSFTAGADQVLPVRVYVIAPDGTKPQNFSFALTATDAEGGGGANTVHFDAPAGTDE